MCEHVEHVYSGEDVVELRQVSTSLRALCNFIEQDRCDDWTGEDTEGLGYVFMLMHKRLEWLDGEYFSSGQDGDEALSNLSNFCALLGENLHGGLSLSKAIGLAHSLRVFATGLDDFADYVETIPLRDDPMQSTAQA